MIVNTELSWDGQTGDEDCGEIRNNASEDKRQQLYNIANDLDMFLRGRKRFGA